MFKLAYAHTVTGSPEGDWERLEAHLECVAKIARKFCEKFDASEWGELAGYWHDIGKYRPEFQLYLKGSHAGVPHAAIGAVLANSQAGHTGNSAPLCFVIAGHHTGLANLASNESASSLGERARSLPTPMKIILQDNAAVLKAIQPVIPVTLTARPIPALPKRFHSQNKPGLNDICAIEFWTRMLFSALVDADRLATAEYYSGHEPAVLHAELQYDDVPALRSRLDEYIDCIVAGRSAAASRVDLIRAEVLRACRDRAGDEPGRFSLTVPTGGGKTLSAMSFALRHAECHSMDRVIVVIPYTSIIEQNAARYRDALNNPERPDVNNVLEHHSNLDEQALREADEPAEIRRKLAAENWDAPVIVTTTVQFLESLFSNHPSRCRKLHNIARSVIILDEVQTLPPQFLSPILDVLRELSDHYGCTIILSTATLPALKRREGKDFGLENVREIMADPTALAAQSRRVCIHWPTSQEPTTYEELAAKLNAHEKVLAVVHRRQDARDLAMKLPGHGRFHLSALMCPAHRLVVLAEMKRALAASGPCRLVATQLIEAGVDIDFPVVYRAMAGLDSLAQAAGRCDREGKLTESFQEPAGKFFVFRAPTPPPAGVLRKAMQTTETMFKLDPNLDPFDPSTCESFFSELYSKHDLDETGVQVDRRMMNFATVAAKFRLIEDGRQYPIVVPYGDAMNRVYSFRKNPCRVTQQALQPFIVQINIQHAEALRTIGAIETIDDRIDVPTPLFGDRYDFDFGLDPHVDGVANPATYIG